MNQTLQATVIESPPRDETTGFDLRSEIKDMKTGRIIKHQPYDIVIDRIHGQMFKRGGKFYRLNGTEVENYGVVEAPAAIASAVVTPQPKSHQPRSSKGE